MKQFHNLALIFYKCLNNYKPSCSIQKSGCLCICVPSVYSLFVCFCLFRRYLNKGDYLTCSIFHKTLKYGIFAIYYLLFETIYSVHKHQNSFYQLEALWPWSSDDLDMLKFKRAAVKYGKKLTNSDIVCCLFN